MFRSLRMTVTGGLIPPLLIVNGLLITLQGDSKISRIKIGGVNIDVIYKDKITEFQEGAVILPDLYFEKGTVFEMLKRVLQSAKMRLYIDAQNDNGKVNPVAVLCKLF